MAKNKSNSHTSEEIKNEAIRIVTDERNKWENATVWVTEKVAFRMRELIRYCRKNYWGIFDEPVDPYTGKDKTFPPLTATIVDDTVKNVDVDQKNMTFRARKSAGIPITELTRNYIKEYLDTNYFGETLDASEKTLCIDGTLVWKTWEEHGKVVRRDVDLLNFYIDPTEESIQKAYRVTERSLMTPEQISDMDWENNEDIAGVQNLNRNDASAGTTTNTTTGYFVDVWETWGKIPTWMLGNDDIDGDIDGHIIVSGINGTDIRVHLIEENTKKDKNGDIIKPYEEAWASKIAGRWYGLGVAERLIPIQEWLGMVINARINRAMLAQLGLWKGKKGAGITGQMVKNLIANGIILLNNPETDLTQIPIQDVPVSAYKDEEVIWDYARKATGTYEISTGADVPASMPATSAAIQNKGASKSYKMIRDGICSFLERWIERHVVPIMAKNLKYGDIIRYSSNDDNYRSIVERIVSNIAKRQLDEMYANGYLPTEQELISALQNAEMRLAKQPELLVKNVHKIMADAIDADFTASNEKIDESVVVPNLMNMLKIAPEYKDSIIRDIYDILGMQTPQKQELPQGAEQQGGNAQMQTTEQTPNNVQQAMTQALTQTDIPSPYGK